MTIPQSHGEWNFYYDTPGGDDLLVLAESFDKSDVLLGRVNVEAICRHLAAKVRFLQGEVARLRRPHK